MVGSLLSPPPWSFLVPEEIAPALREGRYRLIDEIGMGGMATVYSAFDMRLKMLRAIKILDPKLSQNSSLRVRFEEEAATMARLDHANIVRVYDTESDAASELSQLVR